MNYKHYQYRNHELLSANAMALAQYAESNNGDIAGILQSKPELIGAVDEFVRWRDDEIESIHLIAGKNTTTKTGHSLKGNLGKLT